MQSNSSLALDYYFKGLKIREEIEDKQGIAECYNRIGNVYAILTKYSQALDFGFKSLKIREDINDKKGIAKSYNDIGEIYRLQSFYPQALDYFLKSLRFRRDIGDKIGMVTCYVNLGQLYNQFPDFKRAIQYSDSCLKISKEVRFIEGERFAYENLATSYGKIGKYKEAYENHIKFKQLTDSIFSSDNNKRLNEVTNKFEAEKKEVEQAKLNAIALEEKKRQQVFIYAVAGILLIVIIFSALLYKRFRLTNKQKQIIEIKSKETEEQKSIIEEKNKDITDSITYAKRIQQAKLPKKEEIFAALPNCFVLFKPKDIVSGDFYFFHKSKQSVFIAAADCTGHGVPGAFMSMIGSERLEDAVSNSSDTSQILQLLNKGIKTSLRQSDSDESTRDGMDIAICSVDPVNRIVKYAGANRPLYIIRKGQTEIEEIKATKKAIGGLTEDNQHFDTHELQLQQGDTFYISTDGYADQFSGQDKKLTTKKFKQVLLEIQDKSMQGQEIYLDNFIEDWKKGIEQIDDILVIGVRL